METSSISIRKNRLSKVSKQEMEGLTKEELIIRAGISMKDIENGRVTTQDMLEKESELW